MVSLVPVVCNVLQVPAAAIFFEQTPRALLDQILIGISLQFAEVLHKLGRSRGRENLYGAVADFTLLFKPD